MSAKDAPPDTKDGNPVYASPYMPVRGHGRPAVAVAIKGDNRNPDSPAKIVASGRGAIAEQILELAFRKGIKVREDADLAELLTKLDLDTPIPSEAIVAVAEILARVYEANAKLAPTVTPASLLASLPTSTV